MEAREASARFLNEKGSQQLLITEIVRTTLGGRSLRSDRSKHSQPPPSCGESFKAWPACLSGVSGHCPQLWRKGYPVSLAIELQMVIVAHQLHKGR